MMMWRVLEGKRRREELRRLPEILFAGWSNRCEFLESLVGGYVLGIPSLQSLTYWFCRSKAQVC